MLLCWSFGGFTISSAQGLPVEYYLEMGSKALEEERYSEAESNFATARFRYSTSEKHQVIEFLDHLGDRYDDKKAYRKAELSYRLAVSYLERDKGPDDLGVAKLLRKLAHVYYNRNGHYILAEALFQRVLAIREKVLGPDHLDVADSLDDLGKVVYFPGGRLNRGEPLFKRALSIREKALGRDHIKVAQSLNTFAFIREVQGNYEEALPLYQRILVIEEETFGPNSTHVASTLRSLIQLYFFQMKHQLAKPLVQRLLSNIEYRLGPEHPDLLREEDYYNRHLENFRNSN